MEKLAVLFPPFLICIILTGIHGYLGIHVLARHVIFVDLAMAQVAGLGTTLAIVIGYDPGSSQAYYISLGFSLANAAILAMTRTRKQRVPQEAIIGLVYAIATAIAILAADLTPHGTEHLKAILSGSVVWVTWPQILKTAIIYSVLGVFHYIYRERFLLISTNPEAALAKGINVRLWDFLFYLTFGVIITSSVQIAGVLLVFCYLIAPAVVAFQFADTLRGRLAVGWIVGVIVSAIGLFFSYDRPSGPMIIVFFGLFLILAAIYRYLRDAEHRSRALRNVGIGAALTAAITFFFFQLSPGEEHSHGAAEHAMGESDADLLHALEDEHGNVRAEACEKIAKRRLREAIPAIRKLLSEDRNDHVKEKAADALAELGATDALADLAKVAATPSADEWVRFRAACAMATLGSTDCFTPLFQLAYAADASLLRDQAGEKIFQIVGESGRKLAPEQKSQRLQEIQIISKNEPARILWNPQTKTFTLPQPPK